MIRILLPRFGHLCLHVVLIVFIFYSALIVEIDIINVEKCSSNLNKINCFAGMFSRRYRPELAQYGIMASILEQFEEATQKLKTPQDDVHGFEDSTPMFKRRRVNFDPSNSMVQLCACKDIIIIAMETNVLLRINLRQADVPEEIDLSKFTTSLKLSNLFLSPSGEHCLLSLQSILVDAPAEFLYLPRTSTKLRPIHKCRGQLVTAAVWTTQGPVLLGTSRGLLIETEVSNDAEGLFTSMSGEYWRQLFDIGRGKQAPIIGLQAFNIGEVLHILATTSNKIYHFTGQLTNPDERPLLQQIFRTYLSMPERCETVSNLTSRSRLDVYIGQSNTESPCFGWLTDAGLVYAKVPDEDASLLKNSILVDYPDQRIPLDVALTQFHAIFLYSDQVVGVSLLTHELVFRDHFISPESQNPDPQERPRQLLREPFTGKLYVLTGRAAFTYKVTREDRHVWRIHADRGDFDLARDYCQENPIYLDQITTRQANALFDEKDFELSAYYFSQSASISFEEVALKFLRVKEVSSLIKFLRLRLDSLKPGDKMQRTMIVIWLLELYLAQLDKNTGSTVDHDQLQSELDELLDLPLVQDCVSHNKGTVYDLMATHGDIENFLKMSIKHHDYERVVRQHLFKGEFLEALDVLKETDPNRKELFYTFAPTLMAHIPNELMRVLTHQGQMLKPCRLLPALALTYDDSSSGREAAQYLQFCVDVLGCSEQSLHNLLLALYVKHQPDRLRVYLAQQGQDPSQVKYDVHFALRLCKENGLTEACVQLSALLGLWPAAVELALAVNVELAVQTANLHQSDPDLMKSLWLKIAEHVVKEKHDIKAAMEFLKKCPLVNIEDVLPFFPDFSTIDDFKQAICDSLQEYNQHIQDLKDEMDESSKSAELIVKEMSEFKNRHLVITWTDTCCGCNLQLLLRGFYSFPCGHHFHGDCLQDAITPYLPASTLQRMKELQRQLRNNTSDNTSIDSSTTTARDLVQSSFDSILASECVLCGDHMVESIDLPFFDDDDWEKQFSDWE